MGPDSTDPMLLKVMLGAFAGDHFEVLVKTSKIIESTFKT
jgi:hypothetical protein